MKPKRLDPAMKAAVAHDCTYVALTPHQSPAFMVLAAQMDIPNCAALLITYTGREPYLRANGMSIGAPTAKVAQPMAYVFVSVEVLKCSSSPIGPHVGDVALTNA